VPDGVLFGVSYSMLTGVGVGVEFFIPKLLYSANK
jgi:hypothetical protein